ncbi:MAG: YdcF family protein [Lachnospiraceae bacterium]|nr:YdcF family protein [Lachnospiraceae bacterium]
MIFLILAIICLLYSALILSTGSGTMSYMIWVILSLVMFFMFFISKNSHIPALVRKAIYVIFTLGVIVEFGFSALIMTHFFDRGEKNLDYIVVLGAQMRKNGPSNVYRHRLNTAAEYLKENPKTLCITTGGKGKNESVSEGEGGKNYLVEKGIDPKRIIVESKSKTTKENLKFAFEKIDDKNPKIAVLTNNFHVFRGVSLGKKEYKNRFSAKDENCVLGLAAPVNNLYLLNNIARETMGIMKDIIQGNLW